MVQVGHGLHAAARTTLLVDGDVPPPPPGEFVPHEGYIVFGGDGHRRAFADYMLAVHRPGRRHLDLRRGWLPRLQVQRRCTWCDDSWVCTAARWARTVPEGPGEPAPPGPPAPPAPPLWNSPTAIDWPMAGLFTLGQRRRGQGVRP
ncbi:hypothetical protein GA0070610_1774 [Micromonospora echinofusca]|uniref:Uncharacterized protein n=1 Tax=Micromonospora echinofusca TaxID=47858 RepID=A0A1C5G729_MICEH|nr:hypothetical protein [Micromonospora echinofusca]SCG15540.1 hypothetical protein GA0070610_1774 [Micromonospora echinofusca]